MPIDATNRRRQSSDEFESSTLCENSGTPRSAHRELAPEIWTER